MMEIVGPWWPLLAVAVLCLLASAWYERASRGQTTELSDEEYDRRIVHNPHARRVVLTPQGERSHRIAGRLFWAWVVLAFAWWVLS